MADYATLLRDHVTLQYGAIDRIFLQAYVPKLQSVGHVCTFLRWQRKFKIPSSAAFGQIGDAYVKAIHRFAEQHQIPVVRFKKGQDNRAHPHMDWWREMAFINHFYFYLWDTEWGGTFWKTNAYAPFPIWLWLNGHEWAKRQLEKAGIGYEALDNGFRACTNAAAMQKICNRLGPSAVQSFFIRWSRRLPSPFTEADLRAGSDRADFSSPGQLSNARKIPYPGH